MKHFASLLFVGVVGLSTLGQSFAAEEAKAAAPAKPDLAKGEASFTACGACHGADGNSAITTNPKLAHQHPEYLVKQLQEFKSGKRANAVMSGMAATLSEDDMKNVAAWLSTREAKHGFAKDKELVALGEKLQISFPADQEPKVTHGSNQPLSNLPLLPFLTPVKGNRLGIVPNAHKAVAEVGLPPQLLEIQMDQLLSEKHRYPGSDSGIGKQDQDQGRGDAPEDPDKGDELNG